MGALCAMLGVMGVNLCLLYIGHDRCGFECLSPTFQFDWCWLNVRIEAFIISTV